MDRTDSKIDTQVTRGCSGDVRYELVSYRGEIFGPYPSAREAALAAKEKWPNQGWMRSEWVWAGTFK